MHHHTWLAGFISSKQLAGTGLEVINMMVPTATELQITEQD
jgi:hypothetical protein